MHLFLYIFLENCFYIFIIKFNTTFNYHIIIKYLIPYFMKKRRIEGIKDMKNMKKNIIKKKKLIQQLVVNIVRFGNIILIMILQKKSDVIIAKLLLLSIKEVLLVCQVISSQDTR